MKIAFLNIYQGLVNRGAETFVLEVSKRLAKNHRVAIIGGSKLPPRRWSFLWRFFIDPQGLTVFFFTLKKLPIIWREKFDVIIPLNGGWQSALIRIVTWLYRGKMIISGQSGIGWDDRNNLFSFPDAFVPLSTTAYLWARKVNRFVRVKDIPNGVDLERFKREGTRVTAGLARPFFLCVGALTKEKRIDLAIKAVSKFHGGRLLVVGEGELREKIRSLGEKLLGEGFRLRSYPHSKMPQVYRGASVFTIPSEPSHSFETVIVEAMATNLPVVVNDDPIRREIVGDGGIFVNPEKIEAYTVALNNALNGTSWVESDKPRKQAKKFSWDKIAQQYEKLFEELYK